MTTFFILTALVVLAAEAASIKDQGSDDKLTKLQKDVTSIIKTLDSMQQHLNDVHIYFHDAGGPHSHHRSPVHTMHHNHAAVRILDFRGFNNEAVEAHCDISANKQLKGWKSITGHIHIVQETLTDLKVVVKLLGFPIDDPTRGYALHVHESNDTSKSCDSLGGHFNPHGHEHGTKASPHALRHAGDWGNVYANSAGVVNTHFIDKEASLVGAHSLIGNSIVIHAKSDSKDDSGKRIACCVITKAEIHKPTGGHHHHHKKDDDENTEDDE